MNGFSTDIISILRGNYLLTKESKGLILNSEYKIDRVTELISILSSFGFLVSNRREHDILWNYIVIPAEYISTRVLLMALSELDSNGIIILEITGKTKKFESRYKNPVGNFRATKVIYNTRSYIVIHEGENYGN